MQSSGQKSQIQDISELQPKLKQRGAFDPVKQDPQSSPLQSQKQIQVVLCAQCIQKLDHGQQGRWTKVEHKRFVEALSLYGKNWRKVEDHVGSRSGAQIRIYYNFRSHAQKFFNRLEREFNKQFNGLKSSEIKQLFGDKVLQNIQFGEKEQYDSFNTNPSNEQPISQPATFLKSIENQEIQQTPQCAGYEFMNQFLIQNIQTIQEQDKAKEDELREQQYLLLTNSILLNNFCQMMQALNDIKDNNNVDEFEEPTLKKKHSVTDIGQDESFLHFIIAKYSRFFNKRIPTLNELVDTSERKHTSDKDQQQQRSRRGSFMFYNDYEEDNETKYQQLKKIKENNETTCRKNTG